VEDFVDRVGKGGRPLVIEATNRPFGFQDAVLAARIGGRVVLASISDGDSYTLSAWEARRRGLKIKFVRRMGDDFPRAVDLVSSDRVNVRALVTHRESLKAAPELFEALAQNRPGSLKALLYPNGDSGRCDRLQPFSLGLNLTGHNGPRAIESAVTATRRLQIGRYPSIPPTETSFTSVRSRHIWRIAHLEIGDER
jgi:hypothetical protein